MYTRSKSSPLLPTASGKNSGGRIALSAAKISNAGSPELKSGQFAVFNLKISVYESSTPPQSGWLERGGKVRKFNSIAHAQAYALESVVASFNRECAGFEASHQRVDTILNGQPLPLELLLTSQLKSPGGWWQIWS